MKKIITVFLTYILLPGLLFAQAYEGTVEYNKKKHSAIIIEYPFAPEVVEKALIDKIERLGNKGKEEKGIFNNDKGFRNFKNAYITDISETRYNYAVKVDRKSKKDSDRSLIYLLIMKDNETSLVSTSADEVSRAKDFLNDLLPEVEASQLDFDIRTQEETIAKNEKKMKNLQDDKKNMEEKIRKLEQDIRNNIRDQENLQKEIENQRSSLDILKGRKRA